MIEESGSGSIPLTHGSESGSRPKKIRIQVRIRIRNTATHLLLYPNTGVTAALELALVSKDLTNMEKLDFVRRKVEFMQEFGDVGRSVSC
jgi:hypothetical protein